MTNRGLDFQVTFYFWDERTETLRVSLDCGSCSNCGFSSIELRFILNRNRWHRIYCRRLHFVEPSVLTSVHDVADQMNSELARPLQLQAGQWVRLGPTVRTTEL